MPVCFWEDLVNTVQAECGDGGGGGGGVDGVLSYVDITPGNCGGSEGRFALSDSGMSEALGAALAIASDVTITGVYQDDIPVDDFLFAINDDIAEYVVFDDVSYPLTYDAGFYSAWITDEVPALDATLGQWFRLDVDGTIFYGATPLTTDC